MKPQSNLNLVKLMSVAALAALPLFAGACIAQTGAGTEDPGSSQEDVTVATATVQQPQPQKGMRTTTDNSLAAKFTQSTVVEGRVIRESAPVGNDPGGAVKDDGNEPDPVPWNPERTSALHH